MKIKFSKHILEDKIPLLRKRGFEVNRKAIKDTVNNPDHIDSESDAPNIIASKSFDRTHILRVVYKIENGIIKLITIYPGEKGRYY